MWCVKFLSSHEEVAGKIIPWKVGKIKKTSRRRCQCQQSINLHFTLNDLPVKNAIWLHKNKIRRNMTNNILNGIREKHPGFSL